MAKAILKPQVSQMYRKQEGVSPLSGPEFQEVVDAALCILARFRRRDYLWITRHISYIANLPLPTGDSYYALKKNAFILNFYLRGYSRNENTPAWSAVWLAGTFCFLAVQARISRSCPNALFSRTGRICTLCMDAARRLTDAASEEEEIYDFTTMFR